MNVCLNIFPTISRRLRLPLTNSSFGETVFLRELRAVEMSLVYNICVTVHAMYVEEPYSIQFSTVTEAHNISMYK